MPARCRVAPASDRERRDAAAARLANDVEFFVAPQARSSDDDAIPARPVLHVPAIDTSPYAELSPDRRALMGRMSALYRLARGGEAVPPVITLSANSLLRRVFPREQLLARIDSYRRNTLQPKDAENEIDPQVEQAMRELGYIK